MTAVAEPVIERPILFSGPMVRAILDGRKTQTRRVLTAKNLHHIARGDRKARKEWGDAQFVEIAMRDIPDHVLHFCPYGQPGDRLWVRETWYCDDYSAGDFESDLCEKPAPTREARIERWRSEMFYRADGEPQFEADENPRFWKPSIHMPRWASRITLEITGLRVERIQDISEADAVAEGVERSDDPGLKSWPWLGADHPIKGTPKVFPTARQAFESCWNALNGDRGFGWAANPWVWVVEFRRVA